MVEEEETVVVVMAAAARHLAVDELVREQHRGGAPVCGHRLELVLLRAALVLAVAPDAGEGDTADDEEDLEDRLPPPVRLELIRRGEDGGETEAWRPGGEGGGAAAMCLPCSRWRPFPASCTERWGCPQTEESARPRSSPIPMRSW